MKRTDLEKHQRELKKAHKKQDVLKRKSDAVGSTKKIGNYINDLFALFLYDQEKIFNITSDIKILELVENMKLDIPDKQWENVFRKAIKKTNISNKEHALNELKELIGM